MSESVDVEKHNLVGETGKTSFIVVSSGQFTIQTVAHFNKAFWELRLHVYKTPRLSRRSTAPHDADPHESADPCRFDRPILLPLTPEFDDVVGGNAYHFQAFYCEALLPAIRPHTRFPSAKDRILFMTFFCIEEGF